MSLGKILVVEDNNFVRMQIVQYLRSADFECIEAETGDQGLEQVNDQIKAAIVDVRMEPIDGFEFIQAVMARGLDIPIILVTGDQNPDVLEKSAQWSVDTVLMKPVKKERLISMVSRAIAKAERKRG